MKWAGYRKYYLLVDCGDVVLPTTEFSLESWFYVAALSGDEVFSRGVLVP